LIDDMASDVLAVQEVGQPDALHDLADLVNGLPGAGKTTLATALAGELAAVLLSKDAIKQALATVLPDSVVDRDLGVVAIQAAWNLAGRLPGVVVVESSWFRRRDLRFVDAELRAVGTVRAVEVWCDVPADVARGRYATRVRSALHDDARRLAEDWDEWAARAEPLALTPVVKVDTSRPVDLNSLAHAVRRELDAGGGPVRAGARADC
jgi:predicted kinase